MKKSILLNGLKYGLGLAVMAYLVWANRAGLGALWRKHVLEGEPINGLALSLAAGIGLASILLTFVRWYILVRAQGLPFTLVNALRLGLVGYFFSNFLPSSIGGDIIKAAFIAREQDRRTVAVATVAIDRLVGLWGLFWLVALSGGAFWALGMVPSIAEGILKTIILVAMGLALATLGAWFLLGLLPPFRAQRFAGRLEGIPRVGHALAELWRALWMYRCQGRSIALAVVLSVIGHVGFVLTYYFAGRTLFPADQIPPLVAHFLLIPIGMTFQAGFPAPGGLGGAELCYGWLYSLINPHFDQNGFFMALVKRMIDWGWGLAGYLVYLRMRPALLKAQPAGTTGEPEVGDEEPLPPGPEGFEARPQFISEQ
ncbi:MAG: flippase-like domain-containing protein [Planctomycetes bacterium]|nr:flippase-like domain-containing protein [Planctomycetota bacterium]